MMDCAVIGGGPAGAAAAITLARAGRDVTVFERESGPAHKVCGDFLSVEAVAAIAALGVDMAALRPAPISAVRLAHGRRVAESALPFPAFGLTRRALDEALLRRAEQEGAAVRRGHKVGRLRQEDGRLVLDEAEAATAILATGKHALRGAKRPAEPGPLVGLKTYLRLRHAQTEALRGHVEIVLHAGGYAGLQLVEDDAAALCILTDRSALTRRGGLESVVSALRAEAPHLAARLAGSEPLQARPLTVSGLPYGWTYRAGPADPEALFRVGDQAAVIASLTGDGVAIGLHTGRAAARAILAGAAAQGHHRGIRGQLRPQIRRAQALHRVLTTARLQPWAAALCGLAPGLLRIAAGATRIPRGGSMP